MFRTIFVRRATPVFHASKSIARTYATAGHTTSHKSSGDLPWIIGSLAVTIPAVAYLLRPSKSHANHHEPHHSSEEAKHHAPSNLTELGGKVKETAQQAISAGKTEYDSLKPSSAQEGIKETVKEKSQDSLESAKQTTSEAIESVTSKLGDDDDDSGDDPHSKSQEINRTQTTPLDSPDATKEPKSMNETSGKQEGLSGGTTSIDHEKGEDTLTKPEGTPESSKSKGTADSKREQRPSESE